MNRTVIHVNSNERYNRYLKLLDLENKIGGYYNRDRSAYPIEASRHLHSAKMARRMLDNILVDMLF